MAKQEMIKRIIQWFNKPLPNGVCMAMGKGDGGCKVAWFNVIMFTTVITLLIVFAEDMDRSQPLPTCTPDKSSVS